MRHFWIKLINKLFISIVFSCAFTSVAFATTSTEGIQIYQKSLHLSPERKQRLAEDITRFHHADDLWDALRSEFRLPHHEDNPIVQAKIEWFMAHRTYLQRTMARAAPYLYFILQQVKKRHLPTELVLLPIIESAYNPFALNSSSGAAGIWQMMPGTASGYGVRQNWWYDGRRDIVASTKAALNHLAYLESFFDGNWILAVAAYDTGEGNVLSAIRRNIRQGKSTDFWSLPLAQETKDYVPQLLALATIISYPDDYPMELPSVPNAPYLAQIDIGSQIDLKHAASLAGLKLKELMQLNPGYNHLATDPNGPYKLVLPIENIGQFTENLAHSPLYQKIRWIHYKIKSGDTLTTVAKRFNTTSTALQKINPTLTKNTLKPGTSLVIPRSNKPVYETALLKTEQHFMQSTPSTTLGKSTKQDNKMLASSLNQALKKQESNYNLQPGDTLYMIRQGDNIETIAARFHMTPQTLASINNLSDNQPLSVGKNLIIPTHDTKSTPKYHVNPGDTIYMVRRGDTITKIAKKFNTRPATIRVINFLANNDLREGDQLLIPARS